jgi:hypothetical protein
MMLDSEQWKIVLKVYAGQPVAALTLAYQLIAIKQSLEQGTKGIPDAITGLDLAIDGLSRTPTSTRWAASFFSEQSKAHLNLSRKKNSDSLERCYDFTTAIISS